MAFTVPKYRHLATTSGRFGPPAANLTDPLRWERNTQPSGESGIQLIYLGFFSAAEASLEIFLAAKAGHGK